MKPIQICQNLGQGHIDAYYDELSGKEVRAVLKAGGCSVNVPETAFTQAARRRAWRKRFDAEFNAGNDQLALALLLEWLMRHHRSMLVDYLDFLGVKHRQGETDEDFCATRDEAKLREGVGELLKKYPPAHVATYLLLVGHLHTPGATGHGHRPPAEAAVTLADVTAGLDSTAWEVVTAEERVRSSGPAGHRAELRAVAVRARRRPG